MIPVLYRPDEREFTTQGLGALTDTISCIVTEERNGVYEMILTYPISGKRYNDIKRRSIITAIPSPHREAEPFRVYRIERPINGVVKIYCQHISYDLSGIPVDPFTGAQSVIAAMNGIKAHSLVENPFTMWTDKAVVGDFAVKYPASAKALLGGIEGSVLDTYGKGEYEFTKYTVKLHLNRGSDKGYSIEYGKNLTDLTQDENIQNTATGIYPYYYMDGTLVQLTERILNVEGNFDYEKVVSVDLTDRFEETPTEEQLRTAAQSYIASNDIGKVKVSLTVSFTNIGEIANCDLCDIVTVKFPSLGVNSKAEIVKIVTNVLLERYESIEVGEPKTSLADEIYFQKKEVEKKPATSTIASKVYEATQIITGNTGGYFIIEYGEDGKPTGWAIMDTPEKETCMNVWRMTSGGFGHSSQGWGGPYSDVAITMDGRIIANELQVLSNEYLSAFFRVEIEDGNPVVSIGSANNSIILKQMSDRIAFFDTQGTELAYWTNNTFCLKELNEFVLGSTRMIALENGSLSFVEAT